MLVRALSVPMGAGSSSYLRLEQARGISVKNIFIHLLLTGNSGEPVRILNVEPASLHVAAPIGGVLFDMGAQGEADNIKMGFNFDKISPQAMEVDSTGTIMSQPYFLNHSISLNKGEQDVLSIEASTACHSVTFDLAISYAVGNNNYTEIVTNHGRPFQVTARSAAAGSYSEIFTLREDYSARPLGPSEISSYLEGIQACA